MKLNYCKRESSGSKISIIIPVYNCQNEIDRCLQSIVNQTYTNIEIIVVDDGSTDGSLEKCKLFAFKDKRIKVYHKKNGGQSSARNYGLEYSTGTFIGFVDSDDYIAKDMYEFLYKNIVEKKCEVAICGSLKITKKGNRRWSKAMDSCILNKEEAFKKTIIGEYLNVSVCNRLYHFSVFDKLFFPEDLLYEDFYMVPLIFSNCNYVSYEPDIKYYYEARSDSTMGNQYITPTTDIINACNEVIRNTNIHFPNFANFLLWHELKRVWKWVSIIYSSKKSRENKLFLQVARDLFKKNAIKSIKSKEMKKKEILKLIFFIHAPFLLKISYDLSNSLRKRVYER